MQSFLHRSMTLVCVTLAIAVVVLWSTQDPFRDQIIGDDQARMIVGGQTADCVRKVVESGTDSCLRGDPCSFTKYADGSGSSDDRIKQSSCGTCGGKYKNLGCIN